jgi:hypothetical protein
MLKLQRTGTAIVLITQDPDRLDRNIARQYHCKIMGKVPPKTINEDLTFDLRWEVGRNYRQFVILRENSTYEIFAPDFCPCK